MPPLQPVPGVLKAQHFGQVGGRNWFTIVHYRYTGTVPPVETVQSFADEFASDAHANWLALLGTSRSYGGCTVTDLTSAMGNVATSTAAAAVGTRAGNDLPASTSFMTAWHVKRRYRGGHPRNYLPFGVDTDLQDPQHWTAGAFNVFDPAVAAVISARLGSTTDGTTLVAFCQVSYFSGENEATEKPIPRIPPIVDDLDVASRVSSDRLRSQRRRIGRGL